MRVPRGSAALAVLVLPWVLTACPASHTCPSDLPQSCPTPVPSYQGQVSALLTAKCRTCHAPGGPQSGSPLVTYDDVKARSTTALSQVYNCLMPPQESPSLSASERQLLLAWLVCGAPNN